MVGGEFMKYKVGDKVKLRDKEGLEKIESQYMGMAFKPEVYELAGAECTIREVVADGYVFDSSPWCWSENMIEGLAEDLTHKEKSSEFPEAELLNGADVMRALEQVTAIPEEMIEEAYNKRKKRMKELYKGEQWSHEFECPDGYEFHDENGNVIEAKKIVLEKKKLKYPKSYEECLDILGYQCNYLMMIPEPKDRAKFRKKELEITFSTQQFWKLLVCRDAYWKIAGEEMGLGMPWKPDYDSGVDKFGIVCFEGEIQKTGAASRWERHLNKVLDFPTAEMRDAFYENFKKLIEECKELL